MFIEENVNRKKRDYLDHVLLFVLTPPVRHFLTGTDTGYKISAIWATDTAESERSLSTVRTSTSCIVADP